VAEAEALGEPVAAQVVARPAVPGQVQVQALEPVLGAALELPVQECQRRVAEAATQERAAEAPRAPA
jgi:hypothetical protein